MLITTTSSFAQESWEQITPLPQEYDLVSVSVIPGSGDIIATGAVSTVIISDDMGESWEVMHNPAGMSSSFTGCGTHFLDENNGFMFGSYNAILKTDDGGYSWNKVFSDNYNNKIVDMEFADSQHGFALVPVSFNQGYLLETSDGGVSWDSVQSISGTVFHDIEFADSQFGLVLGESNTIFKTVDGGNSWDIITLSDTISFTETDVKLTFINDSTAFICCSSDGTSVILRSDDYGETWSNIFQDWRFTMNHDILFFNESDGIYVLPTSYGYYVQVFITSDGGMNWEEMNPSTCNLSWREGVSYAVVDNERVVAVGERGAIHISDNWGGMWEPLFTRMVRGNVIDSWFFDDGFCVAHTDNDGSGGVASDGKYVSADSAMTWTKTGSLYERDVCMDYLSQDTIFIVGTDCEMELSRSTDGGESWEKFSVDVGNGYWQNGVKFYDYNNGLILCDWYILKTDDAGETWIDVNSGNQINAEFYDGEYISAQRVFVIGRGLYSESAVWRSEDGGNTWDPVTQIIGDEYNTIYFFDEYTGFIADYKEIIKTADGGDTWTPATIHSDGGINIRDIHFPVAEIGYAVGNGLKLLKTTDGGDNWYPIPMGITSNLTAVHFYDENHGIVMGENGIVLRTNNGGTTFIEEQPAMPEQPAAISVFPNPASHILNITFEEPQQEGELIFYNASGIEVLSRSHNPNVAGIIMNVQGMPAGAYVVQYVVDGMVVESEKIVIAR